ncbi:BatD [hydrothermal vent metagenome]|uniref:BatD n=1 Tax=hydrothermal vent metagenome TaxID=652676 RepID=A0A1W1CTR2_9ZZZZ
MKKILLTLLVIHYSLFTLLNAAGVKATVDTVEVVKGNPVTLYLKATGGLADFPPILTVDTAPVVGTSTSSSRSLSMTKGKTTSEVSTTKIIRFIPEHNMTIPSYIVHISGKTYKTDPIDIRVVKSNAATQANRPFMLKMLSNKTKVHVGESFIVTVYFSLRNDMRISQDVQYTKPDFSAFVATEGAEQKAYIKGNYQVQEVPYIVTATKEGNFTISPAHAKIGIPDRSRRDIFGMTFGIKWQQKASNALSIEVLPQTKDADLIGDFKITSSIDAKEIKANKPVNLTLKIEGEGNLENFEFPKYEIDGVTVYSDDAKVKKKIVNNRLYSIYTKSFALISDADFYIPERTFSVLDTKTDSIKSLTVPAYSVKVKRSTKKVGVIATMPKDSMVKTKAIQTRTPKEIIIEKKVEVKTVAWWMLILAFLAGIAAMYLVRFIPAKKQNPYKEDAALKILYGHISEDSKVESMVRKLYAKKNGNKSVKIDKKELKEMVERFR